MELADAVEKLVRWALDAGVEFADARGEEVAHSTLTIRDGVARAFEGVEKGVFVRVFWRGSWGYAYTTNLSGEGLKAAVEKAVALARTAAASAPRPWEGRSVKGSHTWPQKVKVEDVPIDVKISDLMTVDSYLRSAPEVKSRTVRYEDEVKLRVYASSEGTYIEERKALARVVAEAFARSEGITASAYKSVGTIEGYVLWRKTSPEDLAETVLRRVRAQLRGKSPRAGSFPVVLAPEAVGVLIHEAFGHLAEADLVLSKGALYGRLGDKLASSEVSIVDDPHAQDGFGNLKYDDEGIEAKRVAIVEGGRLKGYLVDRSYATMMNLEPTGNARAESFRVPPLVRMRNTYMLPGRRSVDELFEGVRFGYYIVAMRGGETNVDGSFQMGVQEAYEIVNGGIGSPVRSVGVSGNVLHTLLMVEAVARDFELHHGYCGKAGQLVPVSLGGPHIRVKSMTVGGRE